jgi:hypothetical protein
MRYFIFLYMLAIAPAQAIADPPVAFLAEGQDPSTIVTTTTTTSTTPTTLPTIPRCPDGIAGAETGSQSGYNYWAFDDEAFCNDQNTGGAVTLYCFENPQVDLSSKHRVDWEDITECIFDNQNLISDCFMNGTSWYASWGDLAASITGAAPKYPDTCFVCGCFRVEGCFPPGVKLTMADGSLRNIEDVRAGDTVRNAKTGAPAKVRQVIEGPETLPLIRFGFDGTTVTTSQAHPVLTGSGLKPANQLRSGNSITPRLHGPLGTAL